MIKKKKLELFYGISLKKSFPLLFFISTHRFTTHRGVNYFVRSDNYGGGLIQLVLHKPIQLSERETCAPSYVWLFIFVTWSWDNVICVIIYIRNKTCFTGNIQLNPLAKKKHPIESCRTHAPLIFNVWDLRERMKLRRFDPWSLILCYGQKWIRITGQSLIKFSQMVTHKTSCCFTLVEPCPVLVCVVAAEKCGV